MTKSKPESLTLEILKIPSVSTIIISFFVALIVKYSSDSVTVLSGFLFIYTFIILLQYINNDEILHNIFSRVFCKTIFKSDYSTLSPLFDTKIGFLITTFLITS